MSLAALVGLDARALLTTDDPITHALYDRMIEQSVDWWIERARTQARVHAVAMWNVLGEAMKK